MPTHYVQASDEIEPAFTPETQVVLPPTPPETVVDPGVDQNPLVKDLVASLLLTEAPIIVQAPALPIPVVSYSPLKADADLLVTAFQASADAYIDFIELHNMTSRAIDLSVWQMSFLYADGETETECRVQPAGFLLPQSDVTFARNDLQLTGSAQYLAQRFAVDNCALSEGQSLEMIEIHLLGAVVERIVITPGDPATRRSILGSWQRDRTPSGTYSTTYRSGLFSKDFITRVRDIQTSKLHVPVAPTGLIITEVLISPRDCIVSDQRLDCHDYVKISNTNDPLTAIDLGNYILRSGFTNSTTKFRLTGEIVGGETRIINKTAEGDWLAIAANEGTVWLEDAYGLDSPYDMGVAPFTNPTSSKGKSWAFDPVEGSWRWAIPAPYSVANDFTVPEVVEPISTLVPCTSDQYRSPETNRCRKIEENTVLIACKDGQYRSEETNRCRSIASAAAAVLKPCADDQFRNPATNRCKSIASMDDVVQPCDEGKERNPETNRCRTILASTVPKAAFAVEPMIEGQKAFVGWWVLGGVGALALGYAGWEWRREAVSSMRKIGSIFTSNK